MLGAHTVAGLTTLSGKLLHTSSVAELCKINNGNYLECSTGSNSCVIDFHSQDGASTDYNSRIISQTNTLTVTAPVVNLTAPTLQFFGSMNYEGVLTIPIVEHLHVSFGAGGLNTASGGVQVVKTQALSGYSFTARGSSVHVTIEGYWNLSGSNVSGGGISFGPAINGVGTGYYPAVCDYGVNQFSATSSRITTSKGTSYSLTVVYQAVGDTGINGSLNVTHAMITHYT
eukprot:6411-Heterococcus_DN1.PRE.2